MGEFFTQSNIGRSILTRLDALETRVNDILNQQGGQGTPDLGFDVIVLAGQSNMVGRNGPIDPTLDVTNARILMYGFNGQTLVTAADPLDHQDETPNTVGMGLSFAKLHLATLSPNRKIVLVPVARGNTGFNSGFWRAGGAGDSPAIARVNATMAQTAGSGGINRLVAILWHQGEYDRTDIQGQYEADLDTLIARWRSSMTGAGPTTPFICGDTLVGGAQSSAAVSSALQATPTRTAYTGYAPSTGLSSGGDNIHFTAASQREFASRYFSAFQSAKTNYLAPTAPGGIGDLTATAASSTSVVLTWSVAASNGSSITDYLVEAKPSTSETWVEVADGVSGTAGATINDLTQTTTYNFRVRAVNGIGNGPYSNTATATTPIPAPATANDNFTDVQGTDLVAHTSDSGNGWLRYNSTIVIGPANDAYAGVSANYAMAFTTASPNHFVSATFNFISGFSSSSYFLTARILDANNSYAAGYRSSVGGWTIGKYVSGSFTPIGSVAAFTPTPGSTADVRLELSVNTLTLKVNGLVVITATDATFGGAGRVGLRAGTASNTATTGTHWDNFAVGPLT
jgi:hypothetical protein